MTDTLSRVRLNRALLARQMLLDRVDVPVTHAVERLVGLQAQASMPPYLGLWSRLRGFDPTELGRMLTDREVVRLTLMRGTIHLVTVRDALFLRPALADMLERRAGAVKRRMGDAAFQRLHGTVRSILADEPRSGREIARELVDRGIGDDAERLAQVIAAFLPLVQVPPRGVWGSGGLAKYATIEAWTGREPDPNPSADDLVLRYLASFGPASVMDLQAWSGLTRMKPIFDRLRPRLVTFRDEDGRELFDLPDAPRPESDVPAPVRFLGEYDNVLLGHRDRRRVIPVDFPWSAMLAHGRFVNNLLVDGMQRATWWIDREGGRRATLSIRPFGELTGADRDEVFEEAHRLVDFVAGESEVREVRFETAVG